MNLDLPFFFMTVYLHWAHFPWELKKRGFNRLARTKHFKIVFYQAVIFDNISGIDKGVGAETIIKSKERIPGARLLGRCCSKFFAFVFVSRHN